MLKKLFKQLLILLKAQMLNINVYGGPGTGKSTTASGLFYKMKLNGLKVEYIQEYAKDLTYGKDTVKLSDQLLLLGEQHHRMFRIKDHVDFIIHDAPFVIGMAYASNEFVPLKEYEALILALYNRYEHLNIFLERDIKKHAYLEYGRSQTLNQAIEKDVIIKRWLDVNDIPYSVVKMGSKSVNEILKIIKDRK